jgi:hypothetical protein
MSEDLRAALAASERRTARAEEEARVARHERDEAVASAARLREALRTFAEDADEPPEDDREETDDHLLRAEEHDQRPSDSTTNFTRVAAPNLANRTRRIRSVVVTVGDLFFARQASIRARVGAKSSARRGRSRARVDGVKARTRRRRRAARSFAERK